MVRRRQLMGMQKSELPSEYRKVEWLRSTGTQYIDTGYYPTINTTLEMKFLYNGTDKTDHNPFGSRVGANNQDFTVWTNISQGKGLAVHYPYQSSLSMDTKWVYNGDIQTNPVVLLVSPQQMIVNGITVYSFSENKTYYTPTYSAWMFAARQQSVMVRNDNYYTIYYLKLAEGSESYRNFIPCVRKSDNKPGMYDTVTKTFFTNAGTGEFIVPN